MLIAIISGVGHRALRCGEGCGCEDGVGKDRTLKGQRLAGAHQEPEVEAQMDRQHLESSHHLEVGDGGIPEDPNLEDEVIERKGCSTNPDPVLHWRIHSMLTGGLRVLKEKDHRGTQHRHQCSGIEQLRGWGSDLTIFQLPALVIGPARYILSQKKVLKGSQLS